MSTKINFGNISLNWRGLYSPTTLYKKDDIVLFERATYIALQASTNISPIITTHWDPFVSGLRGLNAAGSLLFWGNTGLEALPIGGEGNILSVVDSAPKWRVIGGAFDDLPQSFFTPLAAGFRVDKLAKMSSNASSDYRTYLMADGLIKAVGYGGNYVNGDPNGSDVYIPSRVNAENNEVRFKEVFSGTGSNYAIDTEDNVWSWGYNGDGQLGHGNTTNIATAKRIEYFVTHNIRIKSVVCGNYTYSNAEYSAFFLTTTGRVYACGYNGQGQLGNGSTTQQTTPVRVRSLENITYVYASPADHAVYAIDTNKELWVWGANAQGQLGIGTTSNRSSPVKVTTFSSVKKVVAGNGVYDSTSPYTPNRGYAIAIQEDGTLWGTGYNGYGNLGLGDTSNRTTWTQSSTNVKFKDIACSASAVPSCAGIAMDDKLYMWGGNRRGQLGDGTTTQNNSPILSTSSYATNVTKIMFGGYSYYGGTWYYHDAFYFQSGNQIYAAGYSENGNLGTGSTAATNSTFAPVVGISGTIKDWTVYGLQSAYGLSVLYDDGRVDACGNSATYGETGTQTAALHDVLTLKNVLFIS